MAFTITVTHRNKYRVFRVSAERDAIFIVFAENRYRLGPQKIFLTKVADRWASDCPNRTLVQQLTQGIEQHLSRNTA